MYYNNEIKTCATLHDTYYFCNVGDKHIIPDKITTFRHYNNLLLWNKDYNIKVATVWVIIFAVLYGLILVWLLISQKCYNNSMKNKLHDLMTLRNNEIITIEQMNDTFEYLADEPLDCSDCSYFSLSAHIVAFCELIFCLMLFCFLINGSVPKINQCNVTLMPSQDQDYGYNSIINWYDYTVNNGLKTYKKTIGNKMMIDEISYKAQCYDGSDNIMTIESITMPQRKLKMIVLCFCFVQLLYHAYYIKYSLTPERLKKLFEKYNDKLIDKKSNV
jgi:hypothetical protein